MSVAVAGSTCRISGNPSAAAASATYTVTATAADSSQDTADVAIAVSSSVSPSLADQTAQSYVTGVAISNLDFSNSGLAATGCAVSPALPAGLSVAVAGSTCRISGTPGAAAVSATYTITATAADSSQDSATVTIAIETAPKGTASNVTFVDFDYTSGEILGQVRIGKK